MALGHHPFPTWVFRHQNLDLISNPCAGVYLMHKSDLVLPHDRTLAFGMVSNLQCRKNLRGP